MHSKFLMLGALPPPPGSLNFWKTTKIRWVGVGVCVVRVGSLQFSTQNKRSTHNFCCFIFCKNLHFCRKSSKSSGFIAEYLFSKTVPADYTIHSPGEGNSTSHFTQRTSFFPSKPKLFLQINEMVRVHLLLSHLFLSRRIMRQKHFVEPHWCNICNC